MKLGLALCGGGSLGAYELGVWQYLREKGYSFDIVTGTSIGAINGAMVVSDSFEIAKKMWEEISVEDIMKDGIDFDRETFIDEDFHSNVRIRAFIKSYIKNQGANIEPLAKMLKEIVEPLRVNRIKDKKLGIIKCTWPGMKEIRVLVNDLPDEEVVEELICSASCWPVFPIRHNKKGSFLDGGWRNNLPIDYCFELGADEVIAVYLNSLPTAQKTELFQLPNVTMIRPTLPEGSFLSFKQDAIRMNAKLGYLDAKKRFGECKGNCSFIRHDEAFIKSYSSFTKRYLAEDPYGYAQVMKSRVKDIVMFKMPIDDAFVYIMLLEEIMEECDIPLLEERTIDGLIKLIKEKAPLLKRRNALCRLLLSYFGGNPVRITKHLKPYARLMDHLLNKDE